MTLSRTKNKLRIALISIDYPPVRTSAAVQMRDLAVEMLNQGHNPVVIVPTVDLKVPWKIETIDGISVLRLAAPRTRGLNYLLRTLGELCLPLLMLYRLRKCPIAKINFDLIVWYSPTIFFGPLVWFLKRSNKCPAYLILRDIFPEWAVDLGLLRKGLVYAFFKIMANIQYKVADVIGVQSSSNLIYFEHWIKNHTKRVEVLPNWQTPAPNKGSTININATSLVGRKIMVYIGNMGVAQDMDALINLAREMKHCDQVGFVFVGRGSEVARLKSMVFSFDLNNTLFFDEIDTKEIPGLLAQCFMGLLSLDLRHRTHNIPGKFLTYLLAGLPVLARVDVGSDLAHFINDEGVGYACDDNSSSSLMDFIEDVIAQPKKYEEMSSRGYKLATRVFSPQQIVRQIISIVK